MNWPESRERVNECQILALLSCKMRFHSRSSPRELEWPISKPKNPPLLAALATGSDWVLFLAGSISSILQVAFLETSAKRDPWKPTVAHCQCKSPSLADT